MPQWGTFAGVTVVVLVLLLVLTHLTQQTFSTGGDGRSDGDTEPRVDASAAERVDGTTTPPDDPWGVDRGEADHLAGRGDPNSADRQERNPASVDGTENVREGPGRVDTERSPSGEGVEPSDLSTGTLLVNVALSQGLFAGVLVGAAIYAEIPASALGIEFSRAYLVSGLLVGTAAGIALYVANEIGAASATRFGLDHDEELRGALAPDSPGGWAVLLVGVLPVIAVFEELLFRAALIGALSTGFGIDPWLLAVGSSVAFGLGHGMQGNLGVVVTAVLGFVLAGLFVSTGSLLVVVVAHYLVNAFEFVVHEGVGFDWAETIES